MLEYGLNVGLGCGTLGISDFKSGIGDAPKRSRRSPDMESLQLNKPGAVRSVGLKNGKEENDGSGNIPYPAESYPTSI